MPAQMTQATLDVISLRLQAVEETLRELLARVPDPRQQPQQPSRPPTPPPK
jgi:hypothetical protein